MKNRLALITAILTLTLPTSAFAYIGPGAGLSLLGALWALIAAIGTALFFVVAWPVRKMLRRRRAGPVANEGHEADEAIVTTREREKQGS